MLLGYLENLKDLKKMKKKKKKSLVCGFTATTTTGCLFHQKEHIVSLMNRVHFPYLSMSDSILGVLGTASPTFYS